MTRPTVLVAGPVLFAITVLWGPPGTLGEPAWRVAGLALWMAVWWLSAVVPLEATSLLPIVILPVSGGGALLDVTARYADPIIFLFLGGFLLAAALERWDLHKRFALTTIHVVGTDAQRVVLAFMLATGFASMWVSNTATTIMMMPIAMAVCSGIPSGNGNTGDRERFGTALLIGIAYSASIGGLTTLIGTPPNAIMAAAARDLAGVELSFAGWLPIGLSVSVPMMALCWLWLTRFFRIRGTVEGLTETVSRERSKLGAVTSGERLVLAVAGLAAFAWVFRAPKDLGAFRIPGLTDLLPGISDPAIAVAAALLLFAIPLPRSARYPRALDWETASKVPWGILLLFGGGLALARAFETSGLTDWIGGRIEVLAGAPVIVIILATTALFVLLTELTSNAATTSLGMPLMVGVAIGIGMPPAPLMIAAALAASMAFMLPVATPPNAIVFGSRIIRIRDMARAGLVMNLFAVAVITVVVLIWVV